MISFSFILKLLFFNNFLNKIEPIIETTPFLGELINNSRENPKLYFVLQLDDRKMNSNLKHGDRKDFKNHLNINISEEMIKVTKTKKKLKFSFKKKVIIHSLEGWNAQKIIFEENCKKSIMSASLKDLAISNSKLENYQKRVSLVSKINEKTVRKLSNYFLIKNKTGYNLKIIEPILQKKKFLDEKFVNKNVKIFFFYFFMI